MFCSSDYFMYYYFNNNTYDLPRGAVMLHIGPEAFPLLNEITINKLHFIFIVLSFLVLETDDLKHHV